MCRRPEIGGGDPLVVGAQLVRRRPRGSPRRCAAHRRGRRGRAPAAMFCSTSSMVTPARFSSASVRKIVLHDERREAERGLVEEQQLRPRHQRAGERQHLLLAAGQRAGLLVHALAQDREEVVDALAVLGDAGAVAHARRRRAAGSPPRSGEPKTRRPSGQWATPSRTMRDGGSRSMRSPAKRIAPARGRISPEMVRSVVLLPAPLAPSSATTSPGATARLTPAQRGDRRHSSR